MTIPNSQRRCLPGAGVEAISARRRDAASARASSKNAAQALGAAAPFRHGRYDLFVSWQLEVGG